MADRPGLNAGQEPPVPDAAKRERARQLSGEGAALLEAKRAEEAVSRLSEAYALDPSYVPAAINLGGAYILQGKFTRAVTVLEAASRLEPDNVMIWMNLAAAYLGKLPFATRKRQDRAIAAYEKALALDPAVPHVHYNLGLIYVEREELEHAVAHFYRALETNPQDRDARSWLKKLGQGEPDQSSPPQS